MPSAHPARKNQHITRRAHLGLVTVVLLATEPVSSIILLRLKSDTCNKCMHAFMHACIQCCMDQTQRMYFDHEDTLYITLAPNSRLMRSA